MNLPQAWDYSPDWWSAMARPSKLTPECRKDVEDAIKLGATYADAAEYAGISYDTFNNWMQRGKAAKEGEYFEFFQAISRVKARGKVALLAKIEKAATDGDWRAAAWKLERRDPEGYGQRIKHTGDSDHPVEVRTTYADILAAAEADEPGGAADHEP